jgi:glycosyltransferase involved in cell wall biosynthesis
VRGREVWGLPNGTFGLLNMKKVLIITYYWVPSGGSGVQRWVKFVKYLRDFGWEPIVFTPENADYPVIDDSFKTDIPENITVIHHPIFEPYKFYRRFTGKKNQVIQTGFVSDTHRKSWKERLSGWLRGNLFIPDPRICWVSSSRKFLKRYLHSNPVDLIITTGPPHSVHLIGCSLKKIFPNIPWIADFRDPWTSVYYYKDLQTGRIANAIHHRMEKSIIEKADLILVVSDHMKQEYQSFKHRCIEVIPNGFDEEDFQETATSDSTDSHFVITHTGLLTTKQNPKILWKILRELSEEHTGLKQDLKIRLIGNADASVLENIRLNSLQDNVEVIPYVPHSEAIKFQRKSTVLLLCLIENPDTKCIVTGKLFEYMQSGRPIISIGYPDGDAAKIIAQTQTGNTFGFYNEQLLKEKILTYYQAYRAGTLNLEVNEKAIAQYSRKNLTKKLSLLMNQLIGI